MIEVKASNTRKKFMCSPYVQGFVDGAGLGYLQFVFARFYKEEDKCRTL